MQIVKSASRQERVKTIFKELCLLSRASLSQLLVVRVSDLNKLLTLSTSAVPHHLCCRHEWYSILCGFLCYYFSKYSDLWLLPCGSLKKSLRLRLKKRLEPYQENRLLQRRLILVINIHICYNSLYNNYATKNSGHQLPATTHNTCFAQVNNI